MSKSKNNNIIQHIWEEETLKKIEKTKNAPQDIVPEQYIFTNTSPLSIFEAYPNIAIKCMKQLLKKQLIIKNPSCYRSEIIKACRKYSKTDGTLFRVHKKRNRLTFDDDKISNFLVLSIGTIRSCLDNISYTCYYATTIEKRYDAIIAVPQTELNHSKAIEEKLTELNLFDEFELWGDFKQVYNFGLDFTAYVAKQKDDDIRNFIPRNYEIIENEEYIEYLNEIERIEAHDRVDKEFDEREERMSKEQTEPLVEEQSKSDTCIAPSVDMPDILPYDNNCNVYPSMINLFNLCDSRTMLLGLGFHITNAIPRLSEKQNLYSMSIIVPPKEQAYAKKVCDTLHRLVFNKTNHHSVQFDVSQKIKYYFKKSDHTLPIIVTTNNFNKEDSKKFSKALNEYYENKPNKLKDSLIIIAKKEFNCNHLLKITFNTKESPETEKAMKALKADTFFCTTIKDFLENITSRYSSHEVRHSYDYDACDEDNSELIRHEISNKIQELSNSYTLTHEDAVKYAPIVYFLEEYFTYLLQAQAITEEEHVTLNKKLKEVYSSDCDETDDTSAEASAPTTEELSEILLSRVAEAYANDKISDDTNGDFYIYKGCKEYNELICFKHQQSSPMKYIIDLIEEVGMGDRISDIKDLALQESVGESLKHLWKDSKITYAKDGLLYSTKKGKIIALIPDSIKVFSKS